MLFCDIPYQSVCKILQGVFLLSNNSVIDVICFIYGCCYYKQLFEDEWHLKDHKRCSPYNLILKLSILIYHYGKF